MTIARAQVPQFTDYDTVYFADACEPLEQAVHEGQVMLQALVHGAYPGIPLRDEVIPGIGTVGYWDARKDQDWGLDWHRNEGIEITYLDRGEVEFSTQDGDWCLTPGQITVTRPWQLHRVGRPTVAASRLHWAIIDVAVRRPHQEWNWPDWLGLAPNDLARLTSILQNNENPVWPPDTAVAAAFDVLRQVVNNPGSATLESELRLGISQLVLGLLCAADQARRPTCADADLRSPRRAVRMFLEELDSNLNHPWTLREMAAAAWLGRSQFSQYCRELTNMTPLEYLTSRRVAQAMRLLREADDVTITDIAFLVGFQSSQYFATVFRRYTGQSPSDVRRGDVVVPAEDPRTAVPVLQD